MAHPTYFRSLSDEGAAGYSIANPQRKILEDLTIICQRLDDYVNSSPSEPPCFLTRKVIAESKEHSPHYTMAESLAVNPKEIRTNINQAVNPVLNCLRQFIEVYSKPGYAAEDFNKSLERLFPVINGAYWYVATNG